MNSLTFYDKHEAIDFFLNIVKRLSKYQGEKWYKFIVPMSLKECIGEPMPTEAPFLQTLDVELENDR